MAARAAKNAGTQHPLSEPVLRALEARGVKRLFKHQAQVLLISLPLNKDRSRIEVAPKEHSCARNRMYILNYITIMSILAMLP